MDNWGYKPIINNASLYAHSKNTPSDNGLHCILQNAKVCLKHSRECFRLHLSLLHNIWGKGCSFVISFNLQKHHYSLISTKNQNNQNKVILMEKILTSSLVFEIDSCLLFFLSFPANWFDASKFFLFLFFLFLSFGSSSVFSDFPRSS